MIEEAKLKYRELAAKKRAELEAAYEAGQVADPITILGITIAWKAIAISAAVSAAMSLASFALSRALAPKPPRLVQGKLSGSIQIQNSEQGIMIPEIYGAGPDFELVTGANPTYQNNANCAEGAGGALTKNAGGDAWNAGASHNVAVTAGVGAFFEFTIGTGYAAAGFSTTASPTSGNTDFKFGIQWNPDGSISIKYNGTSVQANATTWLTGDRFRLELRDGRFRIYKGPAEVNVQNFVPPTPTYPLYLGVAIQNTGAGISEGKVKVADIGAAPNEGRGGIKVPAIIVWTSGIRKNVSVTRQTTGGGKGGGSRSQEIENTTYDIDLRLNWCRGPVALIREYGNADILIDQYTQSPNPTGVYDPTIPVDAPYDPLALPDPQPNYLTPQRRVDADIAFDGDNTGTGTIQGGGSSFAFYEGNATQDPDPTEEGDIDAKHGPGSTTAHRNHAGTVHSAFSLSRTGGIVPNFTAVLQHTTLKTLDDIFASFCERVEVLAANDDYDFTGLSEIASRGLLIAGRLFQPAEVIDDPEIQLAYNYFVTEAEGQIVGYTEGDEPELEIDDTEVGWLDGEQDVPDIIPEIETFLASEILLPREVVVKSISPDDDWDTNTQSAKRQVTEGLSTELLEIQIAQLADERRATAQRALYLRHVAGTAHKFTLPWTYLYVHPGYKLTINRAEGFTHTLRLTSVSGGIGILECEGVALEPAVFNQPATGSLPPGYIPPQQIPAMTIMSLLDTPLLRDGDITNNDGIGWYVVGTPRTGIAQAWQGFDLLMFKNSEWQWKVRSTLPGTIGTVVSVSDLYSDPDLVDIIFTADATTNVFTSVDNLLADGDEVTVVNTGGALPAPLVAGTSYFVRDKSGNTFKLAATSGGAAIDITTNGTGTNAINVGKIVIDLYGTTQTLSSVTIADILGGANLALAGNMVFNFATATQVGGFPNRWSLTTLLTGQRETNDHTSEVTAGDRFVLINEAVKFVPMEIEDKDVEYDYRAVTAGQSLDDAATIPAVWTGNARRPHKPSDLTAVLDSSGNWSITATGHPRESEMPASYITRIRRVADEVLMRDIPITVGINLAAIFVNPVDAISISNNNLRGSSDIINGKAQTVQEIKQQGATVNAVFTLAAADNGHAGLRLGAYPSIPGDISGKWQILLLPASATTTQVKVTDSHSHVNTVTIPTVDGVVYVKVVLSGSEVRFYYAGSPIAPTRPPDIIVQDVAEIPGSEAYLYALIRGSDTKIEKVTVGGLTDPQTIYSLGQQVNDDTTNDKVFTANSGTDVLTSTAHGYAANARVVPRNVGGDLPGGLVAATGYYVRDVTTDTFKLAATLGGVAIDITSSGTGTQSVSSGMSTIDVEMWQTSPFTGVEDGFSVRQVFP